MAMLKSACIVLSVFLSLSFSLAHRLLLDRARDDLKTVETLQLGAMKINPNGVGIGYGSGSSGGSGYGVGRGSGDGSTGVGVGYGQGGRTGVGFGSGNGPDCGHVIDIPETPEIPGCCHDTLKESKMGAVMDLAMEPVPPDVAVEDEQVAITYTHVTPSSPKNHHAPITYTHVTPPSPPKTHHA